LSRLTAETDVHAQVLQRLKAGQDGLLGRPGVLQHLLGQRRPVVGQILLTADQGDGAAESALAQTFHRAQTGQPGSDHDHAVGKEGHSSLLAVVPDYQLYKGRAGPTT
jgi:hypothetical protein